MWRTALRRIHGLGTAWGLFDGGSSPLVTRIVRGAVMVQPDAVESWHAMASATPDLSTTERRVLDAIADRRRNADGWAPPVTYALDQLQASL